MLTVILIRGVLLKLVACGVNYINNENSLREVGSTLPEDTSREGCGVEVPKSRRAGRRQLGRLEINSFLSKTASGDPFKRVTRGTGNAYCHHSFDLLQIANKIKKVK